MADKDERLAWMIVFATIPVGLTGVALEHSFRAVDVMNHFAWADGCATDIPDRKARS